MIQSLLLVQDISPLQGVLVPVYLVLPCVLLVPKCLILWLCQQLLLFPDLLFVWGVLVALCMILPSLLLLPRVVNLGQVVYELLLLADPLLFPGLLHELLALPALPSAAASGVRA